MVGEFEINRDDQGRLIFSICGLIESTFRFDVWSRGFQLERLENNEWELENIDYGIPLLSLAQNETNNPAICAFINEIPREIRKVVESYQYCQTLLLNWIAKSTSARQLFDSAPNLLWVLIAHANENKYSDHAVEFLLECPRKDLLRKILGSNSFATVKLLNKIQVNSGDRKEFRVLKDALGQGDHLKPLQRFQCIPIHLVCGAHRYPHLANSNAFAALSTSLHENVSAFLSKLARHDQIWNDALNVARHIDIADAELALKRCVDFDAVRRLHDRWTDRLNQRCSIAREGRTFFPEPPLSGNKIIHPIRTSEDLQTEGRLMHHCVASYIDPIIEGKSYLYRILDPERATFEVVKGANGFRINQAKLAYNRKPSKETFAVIYEWLLSEQGDPNLESS